jgi:hypothetical protein
MKNIRNSIELNDIDKFCKFFSLANQNLRRFKYAIANNQLGIVEKRLLKAFYLFKKNKKKECLDLIQNKNIENPFFNGVRLYIIGLVYNQFGHFKHAIENLHKSIQELEHTQQEFIINPLTTLSIVYANRRELSQMQHCIEKASSFKLQKDVHKLQMCHIKALYSLLTNEFKQVHTLLGSEKVKQLKEYKEYRPFFQIIQISAFVRERKFQACFKILNEYKKEKGTLVSANFLYIKTLLDHIVHQKPMYIYPEKFENFPELYHQIMVLKYLSLSEPDRASEFWHKLSTHNQSLYQKEFLYTGEECLFSIILDRYKHNKKNDPINDEKIKSLTSISEKIEYLFEHYKDPISAQVMIKLLWNEEFNELNLARLRKQISIYNKKYNQRIKSRHQSYHKAS